MCCKVRVLSVRHFALSAVVIMRAKIKSFPGKSHHLFINFYCIYKKKFSSNVSRSYFFKTILDALIK